MSDRGIPSTDGAAACPFVAFDDDRDARSTAPDHRHRCFAEPVPAPRAIAHQDAYCLSPAFAVCPAFQDWARREAAAAKPAAQAAPAPRPREEDTSRPVPLPPVDREPRHAPDYAAAPLPPRKSAARDWAAPPPWVADGDIETPPPASSAPGAIPGWGAAVAGAAAAGAAAGAASADRGDEWSPSSRGLADSAAARLAGPDPDMPAPARPVSSWSPPPPPHDDADEADEAYDNFAEPAPPPMRPQPAAKPATSRPSGPMPSRPVPPPRTPSARDGAKPAPPKDASDLFGPAWERPRKYEAYPSLRTRVGLPGMRRIPGIALGAIALVIAAAFLFVVSPMILGLGKDKTPAASEAPSIVASEAPTDTPTPTAVPAPTATTYTVVAGDTLSGIAQKFGVTVTALKKANPQIKNINSIKIGDVLNIPAPKGAAPSGAVTGASPSTVQGASANP